MNQRRSYGPRTLLSLISGSARTRQATSLISVTLSKKTLEALAALRAAVAGEVTNATGLGAARAALRRVFLHFVLYDLRGAESVRLPSSSRSLPVEASFMLEPVAQPMMIVQEPLIVGGTSSAFPDFAGFPFNSNRAKLERRQLDALAMLERAPLETVAGD
jgi:hypothetical protein